MEKEILEPNSSNPGNTEKGLENTDQKTKNPEKPKKQGKQALYWCFTWNNYEKEKIETIVQILKHECHWYVFQEEIGENGTPHLQGTMYLKNRQRLTSLKKWSKQIHWEITGAVSASIAYCTKKETRAGLIYSHGIDIPEEIIVHKPYGWQLLVMDIISKKPDERTIHWFYEPIGSVGKTTLCKYLCVEHGAVMLTGKSNDMFHQLSKMKNIKLVLVDIPRCAQEYINYGAIEQIKNGLIFSGKYEGAQLIFNCPHVICFANEPPTITKMSMDRWRIYNINHCVDLDGNVIPNNIALLHNLEEQIERFNRV